LPQSGPPEHNGFILSLFFHYGVLALGLTAAFVNAADTQGQGEEDRSAFITRLIPSYPLFVHLNSEPDSNDKGFLIYMRNLGYLCQVPYYSDSVFESHTIEKILNSTTDPQEVYRALHEKGEPNDPALRILAVRPANVLLFHSVDGHSHAVIKQIT
jgi:hypothetical protein